MEVLAFLLAVSTIALLFQNSKLKKAKELSLKTALEEGKKIVEQSKAQAKTIEEESQSRKAATEEEIKARRAAAEEQIQKALGQLPEQKRLLEEEINARKAAAEEEIRRLLAKATEYKNELDAQMKSKQELVDEELRKALDKIPLEKKRLEDEVAELNVKIQKLRDQKADDENETRMYKDLLSSIRAEASQYSAEQELYEMGFYTPFYDFENAEDYKERLMKVRARMKELMKDQSCVNKKVSFTMNNNAKEGAKYLSGIAKLTIRAFNGECDSIIADVKFSNITKYEEKIYAIRESIHKVVESWGLEITDEYTQLRIDELRLVYEYQEKKELEKEEQKRIKEQMREEEKARREAEKAQQDAEKQERMYEDALAKAKADVQNAQGAELEKLNKQLQELEERLQQAHEAKARAISQAQLTKSGYVYIISNLGSFGDDVYKIGMTRRLEPMDRVKELGDASVPFEFDVHAMIYSEDAPALENQLHKMFNARRVNMVNDKKEFFRVSLREIQNVVDQFMPEAKIEFTMLAEAKEYRQTLALVQQATSSLSMN